MFRGSATALITPFLQDDTIDFKSFRNLVSWQIEQGVDALIVAGSTGESATLSCSEQKALIEAAVAEAKGRVPVIAGTASNNTKTAVERTKAAKEAGATGCLVVFPYYNKPTFEGCRIHFEKIAEQGLPVIIYYHPGRTGLFFSPKQLAELCSISGIAGLKDCSGSVEAASEFMRLSDKPLFSGDDPLTLPLIAVGAQGVISVTGNIRPKQWGDFVHKALLGDLDAARRLYVPLASICRAMALETNPQCIKYAMSLEGHCHCRMRLPLLSPGEKNRSFIADSLKL